ncbi:MAG: hypothetical protein NTV46_18585 [Verrucomicrobia bacterium]|nr:hypothetical protein [Verrucomicrobiota bacterium]
MLDRICRRGLHALVRVVGALWPFLAGVAPAAETVNKVPWIEAVLNKKDAAGFQREFAVEWDWLRQDCGVDGARSLVAGDPGKVGREVVRKVMNELPNTSKELKSKLDWMLQQNLPDSDARWLLLYSYACEARRAKRLASVTGKAPRIAFVKRQHIRPSFFGYTEGQSDAQAERHFHPGSALCLLTLEGTRGRVEDLLADKGGVVRDPAVSWG